MLRHIFRPSILIALSAAVVVGAVVVVFQGPPAQGQPTPLPVLAGEREIVWLYPGHQCGILGAIRGGGAANRRAACGRDRPACQADDNAAFPQQTTAVPEVSLSWSEAGIAFCLSLVQADQRLENATTGSRHCSSGSRRRWRSSAAAPATVPASWRRSCSRMPRSLPAEDRPLLLLTNATADRVAPSSEGEDEQNGPLGRWRPD